MFATIARTPSQRAFGASYVSSFVCGSGTIGIVRRTGELYGQDALATGNTWFAEEGIWSVAWIRHPSTNEL